MPRRRREAKDAAHLSDDRYNDWWPDTAGDVRWPTLGRDGLADDLRLNCGYGIDALRGASALRDYGGNAAGPADRD